MKDYVVKQIKGDSIPVRNIYCVCRNYSAHAKELGNPVPEHPLFFQKALTCLSTGRNVNLPAEREIQHELEVVVLIAKGGYRIPVSEAINYIGGFAVGLDLTDRPMQTILKANRNPWFLSKSFKGAAVVTEFDDPDFSKWADPFWLKVNGSLVQQGKMSDMLFDLSTLIEFLSMHIPVLAGDLLFTGTPEGVGPLKRGDELELGLGKQTLKKLSCI